MTKRAASYDIDPLTYEQKEREIPDENPTDPTGPHMKNRKIYKLARTQKEPQITKQSKPNLNIPGLNVISQQKDSKNQQDNKPLFSSNPFLFKPSNISLFSNVLNKDKSQPQPQIISNQDAPKNEAKSKQTKPTPTISLFGTTSSSIFGQMTGGSLFSKNSNQSSGMNLFNNSQNVSSGPLFSGQNKSKDDEADQGDSEELAKQQIMHVDPSKSTVKYDYGEQCKVLKSIKVGKYKLNKGDLIDSLLKASLLYESSSKTFFFIIQNATTYTNIFSGLILPQKSQVKVMNGKTENIEVLTFKVEKKEKKLTDHVIKIQALKGEDEKQSEQFYSLLKQVIDGKWKEEVLEK